jgi:hypothetical protein
MKINFGVGPNAPRAGPDEILNFWPVQTPTRAATESDILSDKQHKSGGMDINDLQHKM